MSSVFLRRSITLGVAFALGAVAAALAAPLWREAVMRVGGERYGELVYRCDSAMREHYLARARVVDAPNLERAEDLAAAEIALIDCQDYDIYQKRLMQWGLRENELALLRLQAIESGGGSLADVVRIHEIRD